MGKFGGSLLRPLYERLNGAQGAPDGKIEGLIAGSAYQALKAGLSPDAWICESEAGKQNCWDTGFYRQGFFPQNTTDGAAEWFATLTNGGTCTLLGTQAGYEGKVLETTGAASGNQNAFIHHVGFKPAANAIQWIRTQLYLPDPNVHQYDWYFGMFNKQADPAGTAPTDGAFFSGIGSGATTVVKGNSNINSVNTQTATLATIASGVPQSLELAVVINGITSIDFWVRTPTLQANAWTKTNLISIQRTTVAQRMHFVHYTRAAFVNAIHCGFTRFGYMKGLTI